MKKASLWNKLEKKKLKNKEKIINAFLQLVEQVTSKQYNFQEGEFKSKDYYIVNEYGRLNSYFVHVVPKQFYKIFKELRKKEPHAFLGFSMLCGKYNDKDIRVSCFGVPSTDLIKALLKK
jgi:hypothetical protein